MIDLLALSGVTGLGDEGIAHVWRRMRQEGGSLMDFYNSKIDRLQAHYGLNASAAKFVSQHGDQLRSDGAELFQRAQHFGIVVLAPGESNYPAGLEDFYDGEPPLLYARGNLDLLGGSTVAILSSANLSSEGLTHSLGLASRLAEAGCTLLAGAQNPAYNVVGLAGKRANGNVIVALHQGFDGCFQWQPGSGAYPAGSPPGRIVRSCAYAAGFSIPAGWTLAKRKWPPS